MDGADANAAVCNYVRIPSAPCLTVSDVAASASLTPRVLAVLFADGLMNRRGHTEQLSGTNFAAGSVSYTDTNRA